MGGGDEWMGFFYMVHRHINIARCYRFGSKRKEFADCFVSEVKLAEEALKIWIRRSPFISSWTQEIADQPVLYL